MCVNYHDYNNMMANHSNEVITVYLQIFVVQKFCENVENQANINFRDKVFMISGG